METGKVTGWSLPLVLYDRDDDGVYDPTPEHLAFVTTLNKIAEKCKDYVMENSDDLELFDISRESLSKIMSCLSYKKEKVVNEKGKTVLRVVENSSPTLYVKFIHNKRSDNFITKLYYMTNDESGEEVYPLDFIGERLLAKCAVKIESIFIGNKISIQVKLYEVEVEEFVSMRKRLLGKPEWVYDVDNEIYDIFRKT